MTDTPDATAPKRIVLVTAGAGYSGHTPANYLAQQGFTPRHVRQPEHRLGSKQVQISGRLVQSRSAVPCRTRCRLCRNTNLAQSLHFARSAKSAKRHADPGLYWRNNGLWLAQPD